MNPSVLGQREIALRPAAWERLKAGQRAALMELGAHFENLQHRAFRELFAPNRFA